MITTSSGKRMINLTALKVDCVMGARLKYAQPYTFTCRPPLKNKTSFHKRLAIVYNSLSVNDTFCEYSF